MGNCINSIGLVLDIIGAFLIAYEIWAPFRRQKYRDDLTMDEGSEPVRETTDYVGWEKEKYCFMLVGLGFLIIGFVLQLVSNFIKPA